MIDSWEVNDKGFVEKYNWDDIVDDFEGVLEELT